MDGELGSILSCRKDRIGKQSREGRRRRRRRIAIDLTDICV